jgi:hypothetical protein
LSRSLSIFNFNPPRTPMKLSLKWKLSHRMFNENDISLHIHPPFSFISHHNFNLNWTNFLCLYLLLANACHIGRVKISKGNFLYARLFTTFSFSFEFFKVKQHQHRSTLSFLLISQCKSFLSKAKIPKNCFERKLCICKTRRNWLKFK